MDKWITCLPGSVVSYKLQCTKLAFVLCFCLPNHVLCPGIKYNVAVPFRRAWWRMNARIQVKKPSHSFTSSSVAPVQRVTASTLLDSPACQRRSSSQDTGRPESLRRAPSASDSSSMYWCSIANKTSCYLLWAQFWCSLSSRRKLCQFAEDATLDNTHFASLVQMLNNL